jgi:hypothetical protein
MSTTILYTQLSPYDVGRLAHLIDEHVEQLTPGCVANLSEFWRNYPTVLRHVMRRAWLVPQCAAILDGSDHTPGGDGSFWLGYHATAK